MVKLFRRTNQSTVPADLEQYTRSENWRTWASRVLTFAVIVLLVGSVVWAGVQVYHNVTDDGPADNSKQTTVKEEAKQKSQSTSSKASDASDNTQQKSQATPSQPTTMPKTGDDVTAQPATLPSTGG